MRVLLLGGAGGLGSELLRCFELEGANVESPKRDAFDLTWPLSQMRARVNRFDWIINCAAFTNVALAEKNPALAMATNVHGQKNLAILALETGARLLTYSTDFVFDGTTTRPYFVWDKPNPINIYGRSKIEGERVLAGFERIVNIRTSWLYSLDSIGFPQKVINQASKGRPFQVTNKEAGSPTFSRDLARFTIKVVREDAFGFFHGANQGLVTRLEFAREILDLGGHNALLAQPSNSELQDVRPARPARSDLAPTQFNGFEWRPWDVALRDFMSEAGSK